MNENCTNTLIYFILFIYFFACYGIQLTHFTVDVSDGESKPSTQREHATKVRKQVIELTLVVK